MERYIWIIREGKLKLFKRIGECNRCGKCCGPPVRRFRHSFGLASQVPEPEPQEVYNVYEKYEGWAVENWDDKEIFHWWGLTEFIDPKEYPEGLVARIRCFDAETKLCNVHNMPEQPESCRKFPFRPEDIEQYKNCSFRFEEVKDE